MMKVDTNSHPRLEQREKPIEDPENNYTDSGQARMTSNRQE